MILSNYISKTLIVSTLTVLLVLAGLEIFIEFVHEFPDIGVGNYGWLQTLHYVPMLLPQDLYLLFPMAGLIGSLIGLGVLASHSELILMRVSGMSLKSIVLVVLKTALLLLIIMAVVGEGVAPISQHKARVYKSVAMSKGQALFTKRGIWMHNKNNFIHVGEVLPNGKLRAILRYVVDARQQLVTASFAKQGYYHGGEWIFTDVAETKFGDHAAESNIYPEQRWELKINPRFLGLTNIDTEQKSLLELYRYINYQQKIGLSSERSAYIFWQRLLQPLSSIVMIFLAVPFIFGHLRNKTMGLRIVIGAICGFGFYLVNQFVGPLVLVYHIPPALAALVPSLLFAAFGGFLLRQAP